MVRGRVPGNKGALGRGQKSLHSSEAGSLLLSVIWTTQVTLETAQSVS